MEASGVSQMQTSLFKKFCAIAYDRAGIALNDGKEPLVSARVQKRLRTLKIADEHQYLKFLETDESGNELVHFLDAISTNFTNFFREPDHFELLSDSVKQWLDSGQRKLRIWCAASSTGEEPYTIAITVREALGNRAADVKILATAISTLALAEAKAGTYDEQRIAPVSRNLRLKYFTSNGKTGKRGEKYFEVKPEIRNLITFKRLNLATPPYPMNGPMDMVLCRNVMIYFDTRVRQGLVTEIERLLKPDGLLLTGHSETLTGVSSAFKMIRPSVYQKRAQA
jgi:chemotaxis protein methyltransferase CheR